LNLTDLISIEKNIDKSLMSKINAVLCLL